MLGCDRMGQHFTDLTQIELIEKRVSKWRATVDESGHSSIAVAL